MTWKTIFISIISLFLFLMISGCGSNVKNENIPAEEEWGEGLGELPNKIGEEQDLYGTNFLSPGKSTNAHKLSEYTEYQTPTGNWFLHDGQGHLGYGITSGTQKTGSPIFIDLISHEGNGTTINKEIHIQLTQRNSELEKMELIIEETKSLGAIKGEERIYSAKLPEQENVFYILSAEIIDEHGEVEDTLISLIYVPSEEMNVEINTNKETYQSTDSEATLKIKNDGPTILQLGKHYSLEKKVNGIWRKVPLDLAFIEIAIYVGVGEEYEEVFDISHLNSGEYRIIKELHTDGFDLSVIMAAEFLVE